MIISIHAPARGATFLVFCKFNVVKISIHAPARGATAIPVTVITAGRDFNPRSREGSDHHQVRTFFCLVEFQSTLPRGERQGVVGVVLKLFRFQSTLPRGERRESRHRPGGDRIRFQSTLPRGERPRHRCRSPPPRGFQSTLPRGERRSLAVAGIPVTISIHAPARGAT